MTTDRSRFGASQLLWYLPVLLIVAFFAFPLIWVMMTAFKTRVDAFADPPKFFFRRRWTTTGGCWTDPSSTRWVIASSSPWRVRSGRSSSAR